MRIREPGKIRDKLWFLGREESGVYVIKGIKEFMIISGGMNYIIPELLQQLEEFNIEEKEIRKIVILHAHFDHVGVVPFLKRRNPEIKIYASKRGWEILQMRRAINTINEFSRSVAKRMGREDVYSKFDLEWRNDIEGETICEGDKIYAGDQEVSILEIPGHSSCSIGVYISEYKALFPSDGGGIPFKDTIVTSGNSDFTQFQRSLDKLKKLEVDYFCADHYGYIIGDEAREFISHAIEMAGRLKVEMENAYQRFGNIELAAKELISPFYDKYPDYLLTPEISFGIYCQMLRHIVDRMGSPGH
jgi:glyoxylase-like metal-dependent hydrolase (beta-lactamase superfamily II)